MKKYPMKICSLRTQPEIPIDGNITFLKLVKKLLTPEEIKEAVKAGRADQEAALTSKIRKKTV